MGAALSALRSQRSFVQSVSIEPGVFGLLSGAQLPPESGQQCTSNAMVLAANWATLRDALGRNVGRNDAALAANAGHKVNGSDTTDGTAPKINGTAVTLNFDEALDESVAPDGSRSIKGVEAHACIPPTEACSASRRPWRTAFPMAFFLPPPRGESRVRWV